MNTATPVTVPPGTGRTLHEQIAHGRQRLVTAGIRPDVAALDADVLARHVLGWDTARLLTRNREPAPEGFLERFEAAITRRSRREPVAFITGSREFWGLDFAVTPSTLVPRPESELIVEESLRILPAGPATILDVGTGSGCLAISLASSRPAATVIATDLSHPALMVAAANANRHGVGGRVHFVQTDLADGLSLQADLIVSNPPYVPDQTAAVLPPDVIRYEPAMALFGGPQGMCIIERLFATTTHLLAAGGSFVVEFGYGQEDEVRAAAASEGWQVRRMLYDLQDIARTVVLGR